MQTSVNLPLILLVLVYLALVGVQFWAGVLSFQRASSYDATGTLLSSQGVETDAEILGQRTQVRRGRYGASTRYYITYRISVARPNGPAADYDTEVKIVRDDYEALRVGDRIRVTYLPDQPTTAQIATGAREYENSDYFRSEGRWGIGAACALAIVGLFVFSRPGGRTNNVSATIQALNGMATDIARIPVPTENPTNVALLTLSTAEALVATPFATVTPQVAQSPTATPSAVPASAQLLARLKGHASYVWSVAWSPDGRQLASGSDDHTIIVWDVASRQPQATLTGHTDAVYGVAWSPDGKRLASGSVDKTVMVWDVASGQPLATLRGHTDAVWSVAWSPDGKRLASGSQDKTVIVWDVGSGRPLTTLKGHTGWVSSVAWSPDGKRLASGSADKSFIVWDVASGISLLMISQNDHVEGVAWSPDGKQLAVADRDKTVMIWDVVNGQPLTTLLGHTDGVLCVAWSPDGKRLASGSDDHTIIVWNVAGPLQ